ncbi:MAG: ADP-ribosylglycohydrolase family protein [Proteobacteria bacterium]|nr:ADP-ribosylglycohydrolase family protein [Pseudomonadota bacterium]MDA1301793.1 ADP-ribosylglycohydrolase family protein [Pseudomonadota bacterium]
MGLLYGNRDFEKSIVTTVLGGWDADCTGATSGSVAGMMLGANALPDKWMGPFMRGS